MRIYTSIEQLIGKTPLLEFTRLEKKHGLKARLIGKIESFNPTGSVKDRAAAAMIDDAERRGALKPGGRIIEPTSGNTGIGIAAVGAVRGYKVTIVMPDTMSVERRQFIKAYGAEVVLTEGAKGMKGAIAKAEELAAENPGSFIPQQFENPANAQAHVETTGPEIFEDTEGKVDVLAIGVGTGGTISGTGAYLKGRIPGLRVVAVEPAGSAVLSGGAAGVHKLQGIGAGFAPAILDRGAYDAVAAVGDDEAYATAKELAREEGVLAGISSGAAVWAALEEAKKEENAGKTVVAILPDSGNRYLSLL